MNLKEKGNKREIIDNMEKFYKNNYISIPSDFYKNDIDMQIIEWWAQDEEGDDDDDDENSEDYGGSDNSYVQKKSSDTYVIRCFGVTKEGISVTCKINGFKPFYYIKVSDDFGSVKLRKFLGYIESSYILRNFKNAGLAKENGKHLSSLVEKKDLFGFRNGKKYRYIKLVFTNYVALMKSRYIFKNAVNINEVTKKATKYKLYESNFEPFMRYCHIKDILMAGWIRLPRGKYFKTQDTASTQIEVEIDRRNLVSLREKQDMARFLQASWDIETYSCDGTFPDPKKMIKDKNGNVQFPNEIYQIATTYQYYGDKSPIVKHLLTLKRCAKIDDPNVIVEECKDEKTLIKRWVDTISNMDPDIFYTYNGDSFDCIYLTERALLCGLLQNKQNGGVKMNYEGYVFKKLSRMSYTQAEIKKEFFSSSAYGDSEFNRIYIPGRLNYDLLIHYKRGMKKYPSYKLDFIANEILKQGKNDVTAKDIFAFYESGDPEKIKRIGEYCIMDTYLLQKLVDKQLILTNIIQLANVTFVPIGFLTTRGQTIKVYSQVLRKARQMDFLVPHTNFNEDSNAIGIKTYQAHELDDMDIGEYIEVNCGSTQMGKKMRVCGKISEIISENELVILSDTELQQELFNVNFRYKGKNTVISKMFSAEDAVDDSFTGATVLEPKPGMYYDDNIAVLDFASLYPCVEISRNLCYSTLVMDDKYRNIPGVKYETIEWDDKVEYKLKQTCGGVGKSGKSKGQVCGKQAYFEVDNIYYCRIHDPIKKERSSDEKFQKRDVRYSYTIVQPHKDENGNVINKGVVPAMLEELYAERKKVKKQMEKASEEGNKLLEDILNSTQLAIKVSLNSTYGFVSRNRGNLILKPLGQLTTAIGRMLIEQSKEYAEGKFLDHVKENGVLKHRIKNKKIEFSDKEKEKILKRFKVN
jgi:DNA polymerase delta subunit 1